MFSFIQLFIQPYQARPFQSFTRTGEGGGRSPDAKNQCYHQPIEIKFRMSTVIIAIEACLMLNFSLVPFPVFWRFDVTKFPSQEGNESSNSDIYSRKMGLTLRKRVFMSKIVLFDPKLTPLSISAISKQRKIFGTSR